MNKTPLSDASMSEVLARVAYQVIRYYHRNHDWGDLPPAAELTAIASELAASRLTTLEVWVMAYRHEWSPMAPVAFLREAFVQRARDGHTWRAVAFRDYKRNRSNPRVTNRGVAGDDFLGEL